LEKCGDRDVYVLDDDSGGGPSYPRNATKECNLIYSTTELSRKKARGSIKVNAELRFIDD